MDNELHAIENGKKKIALAGGGHTAASASAIATLLTAYGCVEPLIHLYKSRGRTARPSIKTPAQPPSKKPSALRTEHDYNRISEAQERRDRRNKKRLENWRKR